MVAVLLLTAHQHKNNYGYLVVYVMIFTIGKEAQPRKEL
jgi:hypothetical protein